MTALGSELLEDRLAMDATGIAFGTAPFLSVSFAPDGTDIAGQPSQAFVEFDAIAPSDQWQATILRAFQDWAIHTNADFGVVDDGGQPFGTPGSTLRDERFGDVRIGAVALQADIAAVAVSHDNPVAGTWVGDIVFNSDANFQTLDDLYAVALHEAGHVLGLTHSTDPLSPMFEHGLTAASELQPADIEAIQSLYGERAADPNEIDGWNNSTDDATDVKFAGPSGTFDGSTPSVIYGDIGSLTDADFYELNILDGYTGSVTWRIRSENISLLQPKVTILDENGDPLMSADSTRVGGDTLVVTVPQVAGNHEIFAVVEGNGTDAFGIGGYSLVAYFDGPLETPLNEIELASDGRFRLYETDDLRDLFAYGNLHPVLVGAALDANDTPATATGLKTAPGFVRATRFVQTSSIGTSADVDYFQFKSPSENDG
ncbi:MAG: matrixin family metalloprotease, partial [Planctomycetales bacterium]|nr:matrixin family metalloprotease [Planctomycetales bacterium]